jgi:hypothetical protein
VSEDEAVRPIILRDAAPPDREFWITEEVVHPSGDPAFFTDDVCRIFFARRGNWIHTLLTTRYELLETTGFLPEFREAKHRDRWTLYHIERLAVAFCRTGLIEPRNARWTLILVRTMAVMNGFLPMWDTPKEDTSD